MSKTQFAIQGLCQIGTAGSDSIAIDTRVAADAFRFIQIQLGSSTTINALTTLGAPTCNFLMIEPERPVTYWGVHGTAAAYAVPIRGFFAHDVYQGGLASAKIFLQNATVYPGGNMVRITLAGHA